METIMIFGVFGLYIWTIVAGFQISALAGVLNFFFPPLSQVIYSIFEEDMRLPTICLVAAMAISAVLVG